MASRLYASGLPLMEYAGCASGTSIWNKTRSSDFGFNFKLPAYLQDRPGAGYHPGTTQPGRQWGCCSGGSTPPLPTG